MIAVPKLYVDLVPATSFFDNVRSAVPAKVWKSISMAVYDRAGNRCSICNGVGRQHAVEAHERWEFEIERGVQKLVEIVALCPTCHRATHIGLADKLGMGKGARAQLRRVNGWSSVHVETHIADAFAVWHERSKRSWIVDISYLDQLVVTI
jgi:hypothetical protein